MLHYLLDTYAWVEYLIGSKKGIKVKKIIENEKNTLSTPENCISEIKLWCFANNEDFKKLFSIVKMGSVIEPINLTNWLKAAEIRQDRKSVV